MERKTTLDVDLVAVETADEVAVLLDIAAARRLPHANVGVQEHRKPQAPAATGHREGITTTTIGLGLDYDEARLTALATGGAGTTHSVVDGDTAVTEAVGHVLEQVAHDVSLLIRPSDEAPDFMLWNDDLPVSGLDDGVMVELGDFYAGERRRILLTFQVPDMPTLGAMSICELAVRWVDVASATETQATIPVNVKAVPGATSSGPRGRPGGRARPRRSADRTCWTRSRSSVT
jgi:Ca-activated chloride channel family protein